jgi:hypothetical protein
MRRLTDKSPVKTVFSILCGLMLVWAQAAVAAIPATVQAENCGCGGKMACCQAAPTMPAAPLDVTTSGAAQQILSSVPVAVVWVWAATGTSSFSPAHSILLTVDAAPLFARNCVRLI